MLYTIQTPEDAFTLAEQTRENIEALHIEHTRNSASKYVTISMRLFIIDYSNIYEAPQIYKLTDNKLYKAKESGRNQVVV
jgi:diguanylate cyclase (GGDEF)-like protein